MELAWTLNSNKPEPITERTPLDELIEREIASGIDNDITDDVDVLALRGIPADALGVILRLIVGTPTRGSKRWRLAQLRLVVLAHEAGLDGVADKSLSELARELGCTRSLLSFYATRLIDSLGQAQVRGGKRRESREAYRQNAINCHTRAGHKIATTKKQPRQFSYVE